MVEIIAEISGNHGGDKNKALELIWRASHAGCQYAKFQYYRPEDMPDRHEGNNEEMYRKLMVPDEWLPDFFAGAKQCGIGLFASVFSVRAVRELLKYDVPYIKIASPESTRLPIETRLAIIAAVPAHVGIIISSGQVDAWDSLPMGVDFHRMYCPHGYPPVISSDDFQFIWEWGANGLSDHSSGIALPLAFIRRGGKMIEKHFKLDDDCIDAAFSADAATMHQLCRIANG